ncbi:MAG: hypothetical protein JWN91_1482, partial [Nocardioides sp.]|nr:hypothetical protein [Nocardioides sp.]
MPGRPTRLEGMTMNAVHLPP